MTVALYARASTPHQAHTQTIEQQLERLRARAGECAREQPPLEECLMFRDDGYSGATLRRPGLDAPRDAVGSARIERVLMTAPDRLARQYVHQVLLLEELLAAFRGAPADLGSLADAAAHFRTVAARYWPDLFAG